MQLKDRLTNAECIKLAEFVGKVGSPPWSNRLYHFHDFLIRRVLVGGFLGFVIGETPKALRKTIFGPSEDKLRTWNSLEDLKKQIDELSKDVLIVLNMIYVA